MLAQKSQTSMSMIFPLIHKMHELGGKQHEVGLGELENE